MKKVLLIGNVACGKTTLCQRINGMDRVYQKTQALQVVNTTIDTPGEYLEQRSFFQALVVTAVEADVALFLQDATGERFLYSPGQATAFPIPVVGVITKIDLASPKQIENARELLELAGASLTFPVSAVTGEGIDKLVGFLESPEEKAESTPNLSSSKIPIA